MAWSEQMQLRAARGSWILVCGAPGAAILLCASLARAQSASDVAATARELFDRGRSLMESKSYQEACPKFEESQRLDPGGGTLLNLALCHELTGKTATAWAEFVEGLRLARRDNRADREELAQAHVAALQPKLSRLRLIVPIETRVPNLVIRRNGIELGEAAWGDAIPVDPGEQVLEVLAPGRVAAHLTITVSADGETREVAIAPLEPDVIATRAPSVPPTNTITNPIPPTQKPEVDHASSRRWVGGIFAGTGVAAFGVAAYLAVRAVELNHEAERDCCGPRSVPESQRALRYADASTAVDIGGLVLAGLGAYLFLSSPRTTASLALDSSSAGARITGKF
jgi:hypothetical protein